MLPPGSPSWASKGSSTCRQLATDRSAHRRVQETQNAPRHGRLTPAAGAITFERTAVTSGRDRGRADRLNNTARVPVETLTKPITEPVYSISSLAFIESRCPVDTEAPTARSRLGLLGPCLRGPARRRSRRARCERRAWASPAPAYHSLHDELGYAGSEAISWRRVVQDLCHTRPEVFERTDPAVR